MTKSIAELNEFLFAQLERLDVEKLSAEKIGQECQRAEAIVAISDQIARNAELQLKAAKLYADHRDLVLPYLPKIGKA